MLILKLLFQSFSPFSSMKLNYSVHPDRIFNHKSMIYPFFVFLPILELEHERPWEILSLLQHQKQVFLNILYALRAHVNLL